MQIIADLHTHTNVTDHAFSTLTEMVQAAHDMGLKAIAITNHGPTNPDGPHEWHFSNLNLVPRKMNGVTVIRGIPVVVLLLIFYYIIMVSAEGTAVGIITFGINSGAYMAELIRGGIGAVDRGQMEAGRSLGMSRLQAMRKVVFPQAVKNILPAIGNEFISLLKETSVAGYVAVVDITRAGNLIRNNTYDAVNPLLVVAIVYLSMVVALSQLMRRLERRLGKSDKRS